MDNKIHNMDIIMNMIKRDRDNNFDVRAMIGIGILQTYLRLDYDETQQSINGYLYSEDEPEEKEFIEFIKE